MMQILYVESALDDAFRLDAKSLTKFREILKCYEGTHNFHNFTVGKNFNDSSCKRYIMSMTVGEPFIPKESKGEWVSVKIHGQSFMLHQIRKMIGLAILMVCILSKPTKEFHKSNHLIISLCRSEALLPPS